MEQEILRKLQGSEWFRERRNKDRGIALMLIDRYHLQITPAQLTLVIQDAFSMDRYWRKHTKDYIGLRGKDYDTKMIVTQRKQINLGYESGYFDDLKIHGKM